MPNDQLEMLRFLVLCLPAVPAVAAVVVALLGPTRAREVRAISLGATLACLIMARPSHLPLSVTTVPRASNPSAPENVPGAAADNRHATSWTLLKLGDAGAIQFYFGLDGLNIWLVALTGAADGGRRAGVLDIDPGARK